MVGVPDMAVIRSFSAFCRLATSSVRSTIVGIREELFIDARCLLYQETALRIPV